MFINFTVPFYSSENLGSWFPCGDTPDVNWCCARGIGEPQPADETVPSLQRWTHHPTTCRTPASQAVTVGCGWATVMLRLYVQMGCTDSTNTALVFFMLQSVSSSYTFNFNEQILPDLQHYHMLSSGMKWYYVRINCNLPGLWWCHCTGYKT